MKQCTTANGAELILNETSFSKALELQNVVFEELKKLKIDIGEIELETANVSNLLNCFKDLFLNLMTSSRFEKIIFECLAKCTYKGIQINKDLFENVPEARADFYEIIKECVEINLSPFIKSLTSQFLTLFPTQAITELQELNTQENKTN